MKLSQMLIVFCVIFIAYALVNKHFTKINALIPRFSATQNESINLDSKITVAPQQEGSIVGNAASSIINKTLENPAGRALFEEMVIKLLSGNKENSADLMYRSFVFKDKDFGSGEVVSCGDSVQISYKVSSVGAKEDLKKFIPFEEATLSIGDGAINNNLENGIIGMKEGGVRAVLFTNESNLHKSGDKNKIADVKLLKIVKKSIKRSHNKVFLNKSDAYVMGPKILCGDTAAVLYSIYDLDGREIFTSKKDGKVLFFKVGDVTTRANAYISEALFGLNKKKAKASIIFDKQDLSFIQEVSVKDLPPKSLLELETVDVHIPNTKSPN